MWDASDVCFNNYLIEDRRRCEPRYRRVQFCRNPSWWWWLRSNEKSGFQETKLRALKAVAGIVLSIATVEGVMPGGRGRWAQRACVEPAVGTRQSTASRREWVAGVTFAASDALERKSVGLVEGGMETVLRSWRWREWMLRSVLWLSPAGACLRWA